MGLKMQDCTAKHALKSRNQQCACNRRQTGRYQEPAKIAEKRAARHTVETGLYPFRQERSKKRVRSSRNEHQDAEQGKRYRDPFRSYAGDPHRIRERADQMDHERQEADEKKLGIHGSVCSPGTTAENVNGVAILALDAHPGDLTDSIMKERPAPPAAANRQRTPCRPPHRCRPGWSRRVR